MITIPDMANVADLQRDYRSLVNGLKKTGKPIVILSNGNPDAVIMDILTYKAYTQNLKELQEAYLLNMAREGIKEYGEGRTKTLKKGQKLLDLLD
ncbi:MAG: type II toxin-antitoxin system prevent-host-death family antitoxin [Patescibacteria group bacterium]